VAAGVAALSPDVEIVVVHDAARPFVSQALIAATVEAAVEAGAAIAALAVRDTVKLAVRARGGDVAPLVGGTAGGGKALILRQAQSAAPGRIAEEECPADYPIDCGDGHCCPADSSCCSVGCCPTGFPHLCGSRCYATLQDAIDAGCSSGEVEVCGVPQ
jgi:hypothetical protein